MTDFSVKFNINKRFGKKSANVSWWVEERAREILDITCGRVRTDTIF